MNNASSDVIQEIFTNLTIREISKLCRMNHYFNTICEKKSLWKNKVWNDHGVNEKSKETWKETAKDVFLESKRFWSMINENIKYFMTDLSMIRTGQLHIDVDDYELEDKLIREFEESLVDHALGEHKEFYATELIFKSYYNNDHDLEFDEDYYYVNFMPLFEKVAELSPGGKISLRWILSLNHVQEYKLNKINDYGTRKYKDLWYEWNIAFDSSIDSLRFLYVDHRDLFIDDTTDKQKDVVMILNDD